MVRSNSFNGKEEHEYPKTREKNLLEFFQLLLRRWYWIVLCVGACLAFAWYHLQTQVPVYSAHATIFVQPEGADPMGQQLFASQNQGGGKLENKIQLLRATPIFRQVVDSLNLNVRYFMEGRFKWEELFREDNLPMRLVSVTPKERAYGSRLLVRYLNENEFVLYKGEADTSIHRFGVPLKYENAHFTIEAGPKVRDKKVSIQYLHPQKMAERLSGKLGIDRIAFERAYSDFLKVSLKDNVPARACLVLDNLIAFHNREDIATKRRSEQQKIDFIDERLNFITQELFDVEREVQGFRQNRQLPSNIDNSANRILEQMDAQNQELARINLELELLRNIEGVFRDESDSLKALPVVSTLFQQGPMQGLIAQYNTLITEKKKKLEAATPNNPLIRNINQQLEETREIIMANVENTRRELKQRMALVEERLEPIKDRINALPAYERQLMQIMRQQKIKEDLFLFLLRRREETAITLSGKTPDMQLVESAKRGRQVFPNNQFIYMISFFGGFLFPVGLLFVRYISDNRIHGIDDLTSLTPAPLLGSINQVKSKERIVVQSGSRSVIAEQFRMLRTNLNFMFHEQDFPRVLLITSTFGGEGKTFTSVNMALSLALYGHRTLVVGMDLRKPKLGLYLKDELGKQGISNYLSGDAAFEEIIKPSGIESNLDFVSSGPIPPNPSELLSGKRMRAFFEQASEEYDYIILDTPPVGLVTEALQLSKYASAAIYVVRAKSISQQELETLNDIYRRDQLPNLGVVLNGVKIPGKYGAYRYRYEKKYGYYREDQKKGALAKLYQRLRV